MIVVGAGMAGLLAANMLKQTGRLNTVIEAQPDLPNNHSAVLRFRTRTVADTLGIEFRKVKVIRAVHGKSSNAIADAVAYSVKTNGTIRSDRSIAEIDGTTVDRYIAPPDLIKQMFDRVASDVVFDRPLVGTHINPIGYISTIPMVSLARSLGEQEFADANDFSSIQGINVEVELDQSDAFFSLYVPSPHIPFSRVSVTGNRMTVEISEFCDWAKDIETEDTIGFRPEAIDRMEIATWAASLCGINKEQFLDWPKAKAQDYSKIRPIDDRARKSFIMRMSDKFGIYSLGRFATWRPGLLLDDLVNDVKVIQSLSSGNAERYNQIRKS